MAKVQVAVAATVAVVAAAVDRAEATLVAMAEVKQMSGAFDASRWDTAFVSAQSHRNTVRIVAITRTTTRTSAHMDQGAPSEMLCRLEHDGVWLPRQAGPWQMHRWLSKARLQPLLRPNLSSPHR